MSFVISRKLSPVETICMKWQNIFSGKNKKNISVCCLLKKLPRVLSINVTSVSLQDRSTCQKLFTVFVVLYWLLQVSINWSPFSFTLALWVKIFSRQNIEIFILFSPENRFWHFMQIVSSGENLLGMSKPVFWRKKNKKNITNLFSESGKGWCNCMAHCFIWKNRMIKLYQEFINLSCCRPQHTTAYNEFLIN